MRQFVGVRVIQANGMDLSLFQFDYDMSFAVHFLNADRTVYARYGSRRGNEEEADDEMSLEGLAETMKAVLALHGVYPANKSILAGKQPRADVPFAVPEKHPLLKKYKSELEYEGKVAGSCIHCHQIHDTPRRAMRDSGDVLPHKLLTPYPMPSVLGIEMDPKTVATVKEVLPGSVAAKAGLAVDDVVQQMRGQAILSLADMQWVLHHTTGAGTLTFRVSRDGVAKDVVMTLAADWDQQADIGWRVSTWDLRRMGFGGMRLVDLSDGERKALGIADGKLGLRAKNVGKYGDHAVARKAGMRIGDVVTSFAGVDKAMSEGMLLRKVLGKRKRGDKVSLTYLRDGKEKTTSIRLQ
jgi:serine protease Do